MYNERVPRRMPRRRGLTVDVGVVAATDGVNVCGRLRRAAMSQRRTHERGIRVVSADECYARRGALRPIIACDTCDNACPAHQTNDAHPVGLGVMGATIAARTCVWCTMTGHTLCRHWRDAVECRSHIYSTTCRSYTTRRGAVPDGHTVRSLFVTVQIYAHIDVTTTARTRYESGFETRGCARVDGTHEGYYGAGTLPTPISSVDARPEST